jgi:hypothetical protein
LIFVEFDIFSKGKRKGRKVGSLVYVRFGYKVVT